MNQMTPERRPLSFSLGLLAGTAVGPGLTLWLAPRVASETGARVRNGVADAVAQSAHDTEQRALRARTDH